VHLAARALGRRFAQRFERVGLCRLSSSLMARGTLRRRSGAADQLLRPAMTVCASRAAGSINFTGGSGRSGQ